MEVFAEIAKGFSLNYLSPKSSILDEASTALHMHISETKLISWSK